MCRVSQGDGHGSDMDEIRDSDEDSDNEGVEANVGGGLAAGHDSDDDKEEEGGMLLPVEPIARSSVGGVVVVVCHAPPCGHSAWCAWLGLQVSLAAA